MKNIINHQPIVGVMRWGVWGSQFTTEQYEEIIYQCLSIGLNEFDHGFNRFNCKLEKKYFKLEGIFNPFF